MESKGMDSKGMESNGMESKVKSLRGRVRYMIEFVTISEISG